MTVQSPARRWFDLWDMAVSRSRLDVTFSRRHLLVFVIIVYPILLSLLYLSQVGHITAIRQETALLRARHTILVQENAYLFGLLSERLNIERVAQAADALNTTVATVPMGEMGTTVERQLLTNPALAEEEAEPGPEWTRVFHLDKVISR